MKGENIVFNFYFPPSTLNWRLNFRAPDYILLPQI